MAELIGVTKANLESAVPYAEELKAGRTAAQVLAGVAKVEDLPTNTELNTSLAGLAADIGSVDTKADTGIANALTADAKAVAAQTDATTAKTITDALSPVNDINTATTYTSTLSESKTAAEIIAGTTKVEALPDNAELTASLTTLSGGIVAVDTKADTGITNAGIADNKAVAAQSDATSAKAVTDALSDANDINQATSYANDLASRKTAVQIESGINKVDALPTNSELTTSLTGLSNDIVAVDTKADAALTNAAKIIEISYDNYYALPSPDLLTFYRIGDYRTLLGSLVIYDNTVRYFNTLDPIQNSYYLIASPIVFAGDYEVQADVYFIGATLRPYGNSNNGNSRVVISSDGSINWRVGTTSAELNAPAGSVPANTLSTLLVTRVGTVGQILVNGVQVATGVVLTTATDIDVIGRNSTAYSDGIIANAKFTDKSGVANAVTTFALDTPVGNTESSAEGNNSVTYVNIPDVNEATPLREEFEFKGDWMSKELVDSVPTSFGTNASNVINVASPTEFSLVGDGTAFFGVNYPAFLGVGKTYTVNVSSVINSGAIKVQCLGGVNALFGVMPSSGSYSFTANADTTTLSLARNTGGQAIDAIINNVSIKQILRLP